MFRVDSERFISPVSDCKFHLSWNKKYTNGEHPRAAAMNPLYSYDPSATGRDWVADLPAATNSIRRSIFTSMNIYKGRTFIWDVDMIHV